MYLQGWGMLMVAFGCESFESIGAIDFKVVVAFTRTKSQDGK
jgi:hypothetical protein